MRTPTAIAVLLLVAACQAPPAEMTEAEMAQIEAEVIQLADDWMDAWRDMETDCETAVDLWHPEHMAYFSRGERVDRAGWLDYCARSTVNRASWEGGWTNTEVRILSPDAAVFVGSFEATMGYLDGSPTRHWATANQVLLVERTETAWGITFFNNFNGPVEVVEEG